MYLDVIQPRRLKIARLFFSRPVNSQYYLGRTEMSTIKTCKLLRIGNELKYTDDGGNMAQQAGRRDVRKVVLADDREDLGRKVNNMIMLNRYLGTVGMISNR